MNGRILPDREFAAVVFDWDGTAVADRRQSADDVRDRVEALCAAGVDVAVVSGTGLANIDGQLRARPRGPGRLWLALNRGSELFEVTSSGPLLRSRRQSTQKEELALDATAQFVVGHLAAAGLMTHVVAARLNRRKIDLIPQRRWTDPPKAKLAELVTAVSTQLHAHNIANLGEVVELALDAAKRHGLPDARVTSDAKHVEIGLTDKADSMRDLLAELAQRGIGPGLVLIAGDEFGPLGGVAGSDFRLLSAATARCLAVSVGVEPGGVPDHVLYVGGGPAAFIRLLDEVLQWRYAGRVPDVDEDPAWIVTESGANPARHRVRETLFTLGAGGIGTRGSAEDVPAGSEPLVLAAGVYVGTGSDQHLVSLPDWTHVDIQPPPNPNDGQQLLDLRTGVLLRRENKPGGVRSARFASATCPGAMLLRIEAAPGRLQSPQALTGGQTDQARSVDAEHSSASASAEQHWKRGPREVLERIAGYAVAHPSGGAQLRAAQLCSTAKEAGFDRLLAAHRESWGTRWRDVNVTIPADPQTQLALRYTLFQLWSHTVRADELALGARGITGPGYAGHVFWDADVFVLPAMASIDPPTARAMVLYRLHRLQQARARAAIEERRGARFPWESAESGADVTPSVGRLGDTAVPILTGQLEEHITADVAWGAGFLSDWTGMPLSRGEQGLITDTARYWESRCRMDAAGRAHLDSVIGPDEYHERVDDNAYTNVMARWNLRRAIALGSRLPGEAERWAAVADALVDGYDTATGRYEQFAGYYELEPLTMAAVAPPPVAADLLLGADRVAASQLIKQPDVLMLHHLVPDEVSAESLIPNLDFYLPRTAHGSSLSPAVSAALVARAGRPDQALELFRIATMLDLDDSTGTTAAGLHLATMGGVWHGLLSGFAGVRVSGRCLHIDPQLPQAWPSMKLRFRVLGRRVRLDIDARQVRVEADGVLWVQVGTMRHRLAAPHFTSAFERGVRS